MMRANIRAGAGSAAAAFTLAAALLTMAAPAVRAHEASHHAPGAAAASGGKDAAPSARTSRNRYGANYFPNVELTTHLGTKVRLYDDLLKGKSVAINVMFTDCKDVCPLETAMLGEVQKILGERVGKDIFFYSLSIDPERDTPQVLKAYAEKFGAGPGWLFLTGKMEDIKLVTQKLGLLRAREAETRDGHSAVLVVGDEPSGQWTRKHALDNPRFLAAMLGTFFGWRDEQPQPSYAQARPMEYQNGQYLFQSRCSACHSVGQGQGDKVGPDLRDVTTRRERAWLTRYIQFPDRVLAARDPIATALFEKFRVRMPNLELSRDEVAAVISYLESRSSDLRVQANKRPLPAR
ncbi:MAG: SCO family protein [Betaproteobacteria bacterium]|nr:SCO family protein [Betaproteobacteria bacterium]